VPFRKSLADILNVQTGFLSAVDRAPLPKIEQAIRAECRSPEELEANLKVAQALHKYAESERIEGRSLELFPLSVGAGTKLVFWHSCLLVRAGEPIIPFFDPRRSATKLTAQARRFVFSTMHERIRAADPDYESVRLGIWQFTAPAKGPRVPVIYTDAGVNLISFDALEAMVGETYDLWAEIYTRRAKVEPKRRSGSSGLF
jgi:hypothetical protein